MGKKRYIQEELTTMNKHNKNNMKKRHDKKKGLKKKHQKNKAPKGKGGITTYYDGACTSGW